MEVLKCQFTVVPYQCPLFLFRDITWRHNGQASLALPSCPLPVPADNRSLVALMFGLVEQSGHNVDRKWQQDDPYEENYMLTWFLAR